MFLFNVIVAAFTDFVSMNPLHCSGIQSGWDSCPQVCVLSLSFFPRLHRGCRIHP